MAPLSELQLRQALASRVASDFPAGPDTLVVHELGLCAASARIDLAVVGSKLLAGWEIKSAADTLTRLPVQESMYSKVFDRVWLVADSRHIARALQIIPEWWGVMRADSVMDTCRLRVVRRSRLNKNVNCHSLVQLLWRAEALEEIERLGLSTKRLSNAPRGIVWDALADAVPKTISAAQLKARIRFRLKSREGWRSD